MAADVESGVEKISEADLPTRWGHFRIFGFAADPAGECAVAGPAKGHIEPREMVALALGDITSAPPVVRIHSQCLTGDVFGSLRCDCRLQLEHALQTIADAGAGILLYEPEEGRGIGLMAKLRAYELQDQGLDTVEANERLGFPADCREFHLPAAVLKRMGVTRIRLITNNPAKIAALEAAGIQVVERISASVQPQESFEDYLKVKRDKMGHLADEASSRPPVLKTRKS